MTQYIARRLGYSLVSLFLLSLTIGLGGATGTALANALYELRDVVDRTVPEIRLATGMTTLPSDPPANDAARGTSGT